jgi:hypothetical protein
LHSSSLFLFFCSSSFCKTKLEFVLIEIESSLIEQFWLLLLIPPSLLKLSSSWIIGSEEFKQLLFKFCWEELNGNEGNDEENNFVVGECWGDKFCCSFFFKSSLLFSSFS